MFYVCVFHLYLNKDRNVWLSVVQMLKKREQLPVVAFTLSKKKCDANADMVRNTSMVTMSEQSHIVTFFKKSVSKLKGTDRELPQVSFLIWFAVSCCNFIFIFFVYTTIYKIPGDLETV